MTTIRIEWTEASPDGRGDVSVSGAAGAPPRLVTALTVALQASTTLPARDRARAVAEGVERACTTLGVTGVRFVVARSLEDRARERSGGVLPQAARDAWARHRAHVMGGVPGPRNWPTDRAADPRTDCDVCASGKAG